MFSNYLNYSNVKEVNIPIDQSLLNDASILADSIIAAVHKCKDIRVTLKFMKRSKKINDFFSFSHVNANNDSKRANQQK